MTAFLDETMGGDDDDVWVPELDDSRPTDGHDAGGGED